MRRAVTPIVLAWLSAGCANVTLKNFGADDTGSPDTETDTDTDSDTDTDTDTETGHTGETGTTDTTGSGFDDPGDVVEYEDDAGVVSVDLSDESGDSNQDQEFYLVVVNTSEDEQGYRLRYYDSTTYAGRPTPPRASSRPTPRRAPPVPPVRHFAEPPPSVELTADDVGAAKDEFLVRNDLTDTGEYSAISATLWALGDNVAIWVDDDVYIDWDQDCDGVVDVPAAYDAYGFDNCDLSDVADIIDDNIVPNVTALFGEASDINEDGRVSVVISPVLNAITRTSDEEGDWSRVLYSYAEPSVDLEEFDYRTNPGSDGQEVIYVYAPDPYNFFNVDSPTTVESYTGYQLAAEVARSYTTLVSYNQHVVLHPEDGVVEEDWLNDVMGTFAADYCGFGAAYHPDAWEYLDAPHRFPLADAGTPGDLGTLSRGAQYLFGLWLYEQAEQQNPGSGTTLMSAIVQTTSTGTDALGEAAQSVLGTTFQDLVIRWQVAMLTTGVTDVDGDPLVDPDEWTPYAAAETISAPPDSPGDFYGANGYQRGFYLNGTNRAYRYGTTDTPEEIEIGRVLAENGDPYIYTPGREFFGWVDGDYGAQVIRLSGINYDQTLAQLQASGTGLIGAVVRWNDPTTLDYTVENIYSATDANAVALPSLPSTGAQIHGLGEITPPGTADSIVDGEAESIDVDDTDRWLLDLTDRPASETVRVAIWVDRYFADIDGDMGPNDPWVAIAPRDLVPEPTVEGTLRGDACPGGADFAYPGSLLEHLSAQLFLSSTMTDGDEDDFDPCGTQAGYATTCDEDWDRDGVLDSEEPLPETFLAQTRVMECTLNGNVAPSAWTVTDAWLDWDELDEDDLPGVDYTANAGGHSGVDGEEGFLEVDLTGGREYLVIVAADDGGTGSYELSLRQLE